MIEAGEIEFAPCHEYDSVGPMAGVTTASMQVYKVINSTDGNMAYSNLNEGYGKVLRYGAYSEDVIKKLHWMNDVLAPVISDALDSSENGIDIRQLLSESMIAKVCDNSNVASEVLQFLADNALSVLNPVMAGCKSMADAAHGIEGSTIMTAMARNGTQLGIRISGLGDKWFTGPVGQPVGLYFPGFSAEDASGDIGDSTITETIGIGGFAMASAPAIVTFVSGTPQDALNATMEMYEITVAEHKHFTIPALDFRGTPVGVDIRKVVELGITPRINTGIAHRDAGVGQVGAGLVRPPMNVFEDSLVAFAEYYGIMK
jgi:hypothetical protein